MEQIHDRVAGLDVHGDSVTACFRQFGPKGGVVREKYRFTTTTVGLEVLADWLAERQVALVAMEATGVYWKPVYYGLEDCATPATSRRSLAARPTCPTPSGWPTWPLTAWPARASSHPRRSENCGS